MEGRASLLTTSQPPFTAVCCILLPPYTHTFLTSCLKQILEFFQSFKVLDQEFKSYAILVSKHSPHSCIVLVIQQLTLKLTSTSKSLCILMSVRTRTHKILLPEKVQLFLYNTLYVMAHSLANYSSLLRFSDRGLEWEVPKFTYLLLPLQLHCPNFSSNTPRNKTASHQSNLMENNDCTKEYAFRSTSR